MIGVSLQKALKKSYTVNWVTDTFQAEHTLEAEPYDLILLDLTLPKRTGVEFLKILRRSSNHIPVIIITARDSIESRVQGLDSGADDYLMKPFSLDELQARIRALLRRKNDRGDPLIRCGDAILNPATHELTYQNHTGVLTARAFSIMYALMESPGTIFSKSQLEEKIYGWNEEVESNAVEVHIHGIRKKFGTSLIQNVRGVGYTINQSGKTE